MNLTKLVAAGLCLVFASAVLADAEPRSGSVPPTTQPGIEPSGGTRLVYEVRDWQTTAPGDSPAEAMVEALKKRMDPAGGTSLIWRPMGADRIEIIVLPLAGGATTRPDGMGRLKRRLESGGVLEFHVAVAAADVDEATAKTLLADLQRGLAVPGGKYKWFEAADKKLATEGVIAGEHGGRPHVLCCVTPDKSMVHAAKGGWRFRWARASRDPWNRPSVAFQFDELGGREFARLTGRNLQKPLAAVLDGKVISIATIQSQISTNGEITGSFSVEEVTELAWKLQAGALSGSLRLIREERIP